MLLLAFIDCLTTLDLEQEGIDCEDVLMGIPSERMTKAMTFFASCVELISLRVLLRVTIGIMLTAKSSVKDGNLAIS